MINIWGHGKYLTRGQMLLWIEISTGPLITFYFPDTGPMHFKNGVINGATANLSTGHFSFPINTILRDQSIFMGIRDREICNGTIGYFGSWVGRGNRLFWGLTVWGHRLFRYRISTGSKIILEYFDTGPWIILRLYWSFSVHDKYIIRGQRLFRIEISTGPWRIFEQADTGPFAILYGKTNGATVNFTTGHRSVPGPVFP